MQRLPDRCVCAALSSGGFFVLEAGLSGQMGGRRRAPRTQPRTSLVKRSLYRTSSWLAPSLDVATIRRTLKIGSAVTHKPKVYAVTANGYGRDL